MIPRRVMWWAVSLFAAFLVINAMIPASRGRRDRVVVLTLVLATCAYARYRVGVGERPEPGMATYLDDRDSADEQDVRLARLDASLSDSAGSAEHFARTTVPLLRRLAAERLRDRSGIDVAADPAGARRLMGEELWEIFSTEADERAPAPGAARVRDLVERLERL